MWLLSGLLGCGVVSTEEGEIWTSPTGPWPRASVETTHTGASRDLRTSRAGKVAAKLRHTLTLSREGEDRTIDLGFARKGSSDWETSTQVWRGTFSSDGERLALSQGGDLFAAVHLSPNVVLWCPHHTFGSASNPHAGAGTLRDAVLEVLSDLSVHSLAGEREAALAYVRAHADDQELRDALVGALELPGKHWKHTAVHDVVTEIASAHPDFVKKVGRGIEGPHPLIALRALAASVEMGPNLVKALTQSLEQEEWKRVDSFTWAVAKRLEAGDSLPQAEAVLRKVAQSPPASERIRSAIRAAVRGLHNGGFSLDELGGCVHYTIDSKGAVGKPSGAEVSLTWSNAVGDYGTGDVNIGWHSVGCLAAAAQNGQ